MWPFRRKPTLVGPRVVIAGATFSDTFSILAALCSDQHSLITTLKVPPGDGIAHARISSLGDILVMATNPPLWCPSAVYEIACREAIAAVFAFTNSAVMREFNEEYAAGFRQAMSRLNINVPVLNVLNNPWCVAHRGGLISEASLEPVAFQPGQLLSTRIGSFGSRCTEGVEQIALWIGAQARRSRLAQPDRDLLLDSAEEGSHTQC